MIRFDSIRFDISHLQDKCDSAQSDDEFEFLPPMSPSLKSIRNPHFVKTPPGGGNQPSVDTSNNAGVSMLEKDDDSVDDSWVRPKVPSKQLEIVSDRDGEVQWTGDLIDSEISDDESQHSNFNQR